MAAKDGNHVPRTCTKFLESVSKMPLILPPHAAGLGDSRAL